MRGNNININSYSNRNQRRKNAATVRNPIALEATVNVFKTVSTVEKTVDASNA